MTNANAEAQRRWRQRQKEKRKDALKKVGAETDVFRAPFHEFYEDAGYLDGFNLPLSLAGIATPEFTDDRGPEAFVLNDATAEVDDPFGGASGALGRAEIMVGCLIDAAMWLADKVNEYKHQEVTARLAEIEAADLSAPEAKKAALKEAARLHKMLDQLDKQVRWTFPQWKVTG